MPLDEGPRARRRKKVTARRASPQPIRDGHMPTAGGRSVVPPSVVAPGARIATAVIRQQAPQRPPGPDTADRSRAVKIKNLQRGAGPSGGPGRREVEKAIRLSKRVQRGQADLKDLQRHLRDVGYAVAVDGEWGDQTEGALRDFVGGLSDISTERSAERKRVARAGFVQPDRELEAAALGDDAFGYDIARNTAQQNMLKQQRQLEALDQAAGEHPGFYRDVTGRMVEKRDRFGRLARAAGTVATDVLGAIPTGMTSGPRGPRATTTADDARKWLAGQGQSQMEWGGQMGLDFREFLAQNVDLPVAPGLAGAALQTAGIQMPKFVTNLVGGLTGSALGLPGSLVYGATDPSGMAKAMAESYVWQYGPAFNGDWGTFFERLEEEPAGPLLDLIAVASMGTSAWARTLGTRVQRTPRTLKVKQLDGSVAEIGLRRARSELMSRFQDTYDKISAKYPEHDGYGAVSRAAKKLRVAPEELRGELNLMSTPAREAIRKGGLGARTGTKALLFDRAFIGRAQWAEFVRAEIVMREARIADPELSVKERGRQTVLVAKLQKILKYEGKVPKKVQRMVDELSELSRISEAMKIAAGALDPETAAHRTNLHARIVHNPQNIDHPRRAELEWLFSNHFPEGDVMVNMKLFDDVAESWASTGRGTADEFYGRWFQEIERELGPNAMPGTEVVLPPGVRDTRTGAQDDVLLQGSDPDFSFDAVWRYRVPFVVGKDGRFIVGRAGQEHHEITGYDGFVDEIEAGGRNQGHIIFHPTEGEVVMRPNGSIPADALEAALAATRQSWEDTGIAPGWVVPEDAAAWVSEGAFPGPLSKEGLDAGEDIPFTPIEPPARDPSPYPAQPATPRRLPDESDEDFQRRQDAMNVDYEMRAAADEARKPDDTFPEDWLPQGEDATSANGIRGFALNRPHADDYTILSDKPGQVVVRYKGNPNGSMAFDSREKAGFFIEDQVKRRKFLLENFPEAYYQRVRKDTFSVEEGEEILRGAIAFNQSDAGRLYASAQADMSTPAHELLHQIRRITSEIVGPELWARVEADIAVLVGKPELRGDALWNHKVKGERIAEEYFSRMGERWLREGRAPSHHSWAAFNRLHEALGEVYPVVPRNFPQVTPSMRKLLERSFDPASGVKVEGGVYRPDISAKDVNRGMGRSRSTQRKSAAEEFGTNKQNTGRSFVEARNIPGPMVVLRDFERTIKASTKILAIEKLRPFATRWDYERQAIPDGYSPIVFKPGETSKIPRVYREEADAAARTPKEYGRMMVEAEQEGLARHFPTEETLRKEGVPDGAEVYLIPTKIIEEYTGGSLRTGGPHGGPVVEKLKTLLDYTNATVKSALVYGKLSYIPINYSGNLIFLTIHSGVFAGPALVRASKILGRLEVDTLARIDHWAGQGQFSALATERGGRYLEAIQTLATFQSKLADRGPRRAAFIYSAGKRGYLSNSRLRSLLTEPKHRADLEAISSEAKQAMVDFDGMNEFEREVVARTIFVYGWIRGATKYGKHLATETPLRADLLYSMGEAGEEWAEERLGKLDDYMRGLVPFGEKFEKLGVEAITVRQLRGMNPVSTAAESLEAIFNLQPFQEEEKGVTAIDYLTPAVKMPLEYITKMDFFFGNPHKQRIDAFKAPVRWPLIKLAKELIDPTIAVEDISGESAARRPNYIPPDNAWDARKQALEDNLLGAAADKDLDLEAVAARSKENAPPDPVGDFKLDMEKAGLKPPASTIKQVELFAELSADERMKSNAPGTEKVLALAELYVREHPDEAEVLPYARSLKTEQEADALATKISAALFQEMRNFVNAADNIEDAKELSGG